MESRCLEVALRLFSEPSCCWKVTGCKKAALKKVGCRCCGKLSGVLGLSACIQAIYRRINQERVRFIEFQGVEGMGHLGLVNDGIQRVKSSSTVNLAWYGVGDPKTKVWGSDLRIVSCTLVDGLGTISGGYPQLAACCESE